jgi:hypothetical protein
MHSFIFSLNTCKKFTKLLQTLKRDAHYWSGPRENRQSKNLFFFSIFGAHLVFSFKLKNNSIFQKLKTKLLFSENYQQEFKFW